MRRMTNTFFRNKEIFEASKRGESCADIAEKYGLTTKRVQAICSEAGCGEREYRDDGGLYEVLKAKMGNGARRIYMALMRANVRTLEDFKSVDDDYLIRVRGLGHGALKLIHEIRGDKPEGESLLQADDIRKGSRKKKVTFCPMTVWDEENGTFLLSEEWCSAGLDEIDLINYIGYLEEIIAGGTQVNKASVIDYLAWLKTFVSQEDCINGGDNGDRKEIH